MPDHFHPSPQQQFVVCPPLLCFFNSAPGLKNGFYFFFLSRISTALLGHVRMSHHLIQYTNMCQNFQQFTNRFTYWMRKVVSCTITVSKTLTRAVLGQWTRGSFKCCARVCFEILLLLYHMPNYWFNRTLNCHSNNVLLISSQSAFDIKYNNIILFLFWNFKNLS